MPPLAFATVQLLPKAGIKPPMTLAAKPPPSCSWPVTLSRSAEAAEATSTPKTPASVKAVLPVTASVPTVEAPVPGESRPPLTRSPAPEVAVVRIEPAPEP